MSRKISVIEFYGFETNDDVIAFLDEVLSPYNWGTGQYIKISNLNEDGIKKVDEHLLQKEVPE